MRIFLPILAILCGLLASCSQTQLTNGYTKADYANLRLRDLNPMAKSPPIVQAHQTTLREISAARVGFLQRRFAWFRKPVDYTPPMLPDGTLAFDGALLPPKSAGSGAAINVGGYLPDPSLASHELDAENDNGFSIE